MTAETPMPLGSTTKAFTAVAVLQLAEQARVDLDAPVVAYLPWFAVADADATSAITVRHLLNHTSGLSDVTYTRVLNGQHETLLSAGRCPGHSSGSVVGGSRRVLVLALRAPGRSTASTRSCLALPGLGSGPVLWGPMGPVSS